MVTRFPVWDFRPYSKCRATDNVRPNQRLNTIQQGFVSDGGDRLARENMFLSQTDLYNDNDLIGTDATTATSR